MPTPTYNIQEEEHKIHDNVLDIWGRDFQFDHEKGLSEWIKNCADAYIRTGTPDTEQKVILRFTDSDKGKTSIECVDFVGMNSDDINKAFKWWGDPEAAKRGMKKKVYGGHGNGGKFYMRQMFDTSHFVTYSDGKISVFGFSQNKKYGYATDGRKSISDIPMKPEQAMKMAGIEKIVPPEYKNKIVSGKTGFTVVTGMGASGMKSAVKATRICEKLKNHPQARRVLSRIPVTVIHNGETLYDRLAPDVIKPKVGFESPIEFLIPESLVYERDAERKNVLMQSGKYEQGKLVLRTSEIAMERNGRLGDLNRVDILGEIGVLATYPIAELGVIHYTQSVFIYGECYCPILEDPTDSAITNDRIKLVKNDRGQALLAWIATKVDEVAVSISEKEKQEQDEINKNLSSTFNDFLNQWKNKFMSRIFAEVLAGPGDGRGAGYGLGGSSGAPGHSEGSDGDGAGSGDGKDEGGGDTPRKAGKFPTVKLSGFDEDPLTPGGHVGLDPRQPIVYQRPKDVDAGIYWINTSSPLATAILSRFGAESVRWRDYLLQRYIDIFVKEAIHRIAKKDPDRFNADMIDADIMGTLVSKIHEAAAQDLDQFLFEEVYTPQKAG